MHWFLPRVRHTYNECADVMAMDRQLVHVEVKVTHFQVKKHLLDRALSA